MKDEFLELIRLLKSHEVEFMVVGAFALAVYFEPRFTEDIEIWINQTQANLLKFGQALAINAGTAAYFMGERLLRRSLLSDTAMSGQLRQSMSNVAQGTEKLNQSMEALQHSFLLRGYFRRQEKKRAKTGK